MSGCNRNDKVVGTFSRISLFFPDFDSDAILTKIEPHNLTIHMTPQTKNQMDTSKIGGAIFFEILADNRNVK